MNTIYTIGHSNHDIETFITLLKGHEIDVLGDVRSSPYSKYASHFNREYLKAVLKKNGIKYIFLGDQLGAKPKYNASVVDGQVKFSLLAKESYFHDGLKRVRIGAESYKLSLMCAEKDPLSCHRTILVCRNLHSEDLCIKHIHADSTLEDHRDLEIRLLKSLKIPADDLFKSREELIESAYDLQGEKIAYQEKIHNETEINTNWNGQ